MAEDLGEKTEEATPKRRSEARQSGNVARSPDFASALLLLAMTLTLWAAMMPMLDRFRIVMASILGDLTPMDPAEAWGTVTFAGAAAVSAVLPVLAVAWVAACIAHLLQIGWLFAPKAMRPQFSKLSPLTGARRIFGLSGLVKASLDTLKVVIVVVVSVVTIWQYKNEIVVLPYLSSMQSVGKAGWLILDLALRVVAVLMILGLLDFFYQRWKHNQDLKMTKQQVKDELKQTEGDPDVKRRRMRMQQQVAMQRISAAVPRADVVVTNPEHVSVAIKYDAATMNAPKVVAKGADLLALKIRQIALRHGIPIVERRALARALYRQVAVNQEIPPSFYKAVAEILAYVYRLNPRAA